MKKILKLLTILLLLAVVQTARGAADPIKYIGADGEEAECASFTILYGNETYLGTDGETSWYVVDHDISFDHTLYLSGDVNLILTDNSWMKVYDDIEFNQLFTIYGQKNQNSMLEVSDCNDGVYGPNGSFVMNGGTIAIYDAKRFGIYAKEITINNGSVSITSDAESLFCNDILQIKGGTVSVESVSRAAIFSMKKCLITGGIIEAVGGVVAVEPEIIRVGIAATTDGIILGCTNENDQIKVTGLYSVMNDGGLYISERQILTDGENFYSGELDDDQIEALKNSTLKLAFHYSFVLPECMEIVSYDAEKSTVEFALKFGYKVSEDGKVKANSDEILPDNGIYSVIVDKDITITADVVESYEISSPEELIAFSMAVNKGRDFDGVEITLTDDITFTVEGTDNFIAIGWYDEDKDVAYDFKGIFDGKGHSISGIRINQEEKDYQGLFGQIDGATIKNLILDDIQVTGRYVVGSIVGYNGGTVENCLVIDARISGAVDYLNVDENYYYKRVINDGEPESNIYLLTLGEGITIDIEGLEGVFDYDGKYYCEEGATIELKYTGETQYRFVASVNGIIDGYGILTMPAEDVDVTAILPVEVSYIDANGEEASEYAMPLTGTEYELGTEDETSWYVVNKAIKFDHNIELYGDVNLILADNSKMTVETGQDLNGIEFYQKFTIYGQEGQSGKLEVKDCLEAIYGNMGDGNTSFILNGGNIEITENCSNSGIYATENITINRGTVNIQLEEDAAPLYAWNKIEINGGEIIVKTTTYNAIYSENDIIIKGGVVSAKSEENNAMNSDNDIVITGGVIIAESAEYSAIYAGNDITLGCATDEDQIKVIGGYEFEESFFIADGQTLTDGENFYSGELDGDQIEALENSTLTRAKLEITTAPEAIEKLEYSGLEQALVKAGESNYGIILYSLSEDGEYTATIPSGVNAQSYTVYYKAQSESGDEETEVASVVAAIADHVDDNGALTITENQDGKTAILDGAYTGADGFVIAQAIYVDHVTFSRAFTNGATSTIILPFGIEEGNYSGGTFYELNSFDAEKGEIVATATVVKNVEANKPYIFVPDGTPFTITGAVTLLPIGVNGTSDTYDKWKFTGVYERKRWGAEDGNNKDYCFAANQTDDVNIGDFVKIGTYVQVKPFRAYLTYDDGTSKAAPILPESIKVRIVDETATVIDNPDDPVDEHNGDFETPVSEIVPAANVNVWSYDKTIYISAAAGTNYRIIDANGRALATGVTATDRDEIHLGSRSGIVVVIINGKTFKINY